MSTESRKLLAIALCRRIGVHSEGCSCYLAICLHATCYQALSHGLISWNRLRLLSS